MPGQVLDLVFAEEGASAHVACQLEQVGEGDAVEQHRVGALLFQRQRREDGGQILRVSLDEGAQDFDRNLWLVCEQEDTCPRVFGQCPHACRDGSALPVLPVLIADDRYIQPSDRFFNLFRV